MNASRPPARRSPTVTAIVLGAAWAVLAHAPASWVASAVTAASGQRLVLCDARGDWRDGEARVVIASGPQGRDSTLLPGTLHWSMGLGEFWRGALQLRLRWPALAQGALDWRAQARLRGWQLTQTGPSSWQAAFPASLLEGLGTPWNTLALRGLVRVELRHVELSSSAGRLDTRGGLHIEALHMNSRLSTLSPLGSYRVDLVGNGASAGLSLRTISGALVLAGDGVWNGQRLQFSGTARAAPGQQQALATLLGLLGRREGDHVRIAL